METFDIHIVGFPLNFKEYHIRDHFRRYGQIREIVFHNGRRPNDDRYGFVRFYTQESATKALAEKIYIDQWFIRTRSARRSRSNTTELVEATLDFDLPSPSIEAPASPERLIQPEEVSHALASEQLTTETDTALDNEEMRADGLSTIESISVDILDKQPTTEIMTSKPEVDNLMESLDQQSQANVTVDSRSTADMVSKPDEVPSKIEPLTVEATHVSLDQDVPTESAPKSPPIAPRGSYAIDWDNFDESSNPYEMYGNWPKAGGNGQKVPSSEALNPFKSGKALQLSPPPSSKIIGYTGDCNETKDGGCSSGDVESDVKQDNCSASSSDAIKPISIGEATKPDCKASDSAANTKPAGAVKKQIRRFKPPAQMTIIEDGVEINIYFPQSRSLTGASDLSGAGAAADNATHSKGTEHDKSIGLFALAQSASLAKHYLDMIGLALAVKTDKAEKEMTTTVSKDLIADLVKERDQALEDLQFVEEAFSELYHRYNKAKSVVEAYKKNEETLKKCIVENQTKMKKQDERYQALKKHERYLAFMKNAEERLAIASEEILRLEKLNESELTMAQAALRKADVQVKSLELTVEQKENPEISRVLENPELMQQTAQVARNPTMLQELMRNSGGQSMFDMLSRGTRDGQESTLGAAMSSQTSNSGVTNAGVESTVQQMIQNPQLMTNIMQAHYMQSMLQNLAGNPEIINQYMNNSPLVPRDSAVQESVRSAIPSLAEQDDDDEIKIFMPEAKPPSTGVGELSGAGADDVTMILTDAKGTESDESIGFFTMAQSASLADHCNVLSDAKPELLHDRSLSEPSAAIEAMERRDATPRLSPLITDTSAVAQTDCPHSAPSEINQSADVLTLDQLTDDVNEEEFHDASQVFNDPAAWAMLERLGSSGLSKESALVRESLYFKFDPLVQKPKIPEFQKTISRAVKVPGFSTVAECDDLLLMTTPPFSRVAERSQAAPVSCSVALSGTSADQELDKLFACSPQTGDHESNVLRHSQADILHIQKQWELDYQSHLLAKERDLVLRPKLQIAEAEENDDLLLKTTSLFSPLAAKSSQMPSSVDNRRVVVTSQPIDSSGIQSNLVEKQLKKSVRNKSAIPHLASNPDQWPTTFGKKVGRFLSLVRKPKHVKDAMLSVTATLKENSSPSLSPLYDESITGASAFCSSADTGFCVNDSPLHM